MKRVDDYPQGAEMWENREKVGEKVHRFLKKEMDNNQNETEWIGVMNDGRSVIISY